MSGRSTGLGYRTASVISVRRSDYYSASRRSTSPFSNMERLSPLWRSGGSGNAESRGSTGVRGCLMLHANMLRTPFSKVDQKCDPALV